MVTRLRSGRILSLSFFARLSWQVVPTALGRYLSEPDRKKGRSRHAGHDDDDDDDDDDDENRHRRPRKGICRLVPEKSSPEMPTGSPRIRVDSNNFQA